MGNENSLEDFRAISTYTYLYSQTIIINYQNTKTNDVDLLQLTKMLIRFHINFSFFRLRVRRQKGRGPKITRFSF